MTKRASFAHSTVTPAPRARVWAALDLPETWNAIAGVDRVHEPVIDDEGRLRGFLFDTIVGGKAYEGRATPHAREEGRLISWNISNSQINGVIHVELEDTAQGTLIDVGIDMESASMFTRMFFGAISRTVGDGLPKTVEDFAATF